MERWQVNEKCRKKKGFLKLAAWQALEERMMGGPGEEATAQGRINLPVHLKAADRAYLCVSQLCPGVCLH